MAVADFNGDFDPDLAVTNHQPPPNVTVLEGQAGGTFGNATQISAGQNPVGSRSASSAVTPTRTSPSRTISARTPPFCSGRPVPASPAPTDYGTQIGPHRLATGDLNGDADPDLAIANAVSGNVSILLGAAGSTFVARRDLRPPPRTHVRWRSRDFNQDSRGDLAVTTDDAIW